MSELETLKGERAVKLAHLKDLKTNAEKEGRPIDDKECASFDKFKAEADELTIKIKNLEEHLKRLAILDEMETAAQNQLPQPTPNNRPSNGTPERDAPHNPAVTNAAKKIPANAKRYGVLKAFKGPNAEADAYVTGQWVMAHVLGNRAAQRWCDLNGYGVNDIQNAMSTSDDAKGGYLVPEEMSRTIIDLREEFGVFRRYARMQPMGSDTMLIPRRAGGVTAAWIGEGAPITASDLSLSQVRLVAKKLAAYVVMSSELAEDAIIDLGDFIAREMAYAFANKEDLAGFTGDGTSAFGGIQGLTSYFAAGARAGAVDATTAHDTFAEVDATDIAKLMGVLPEYARMNAKFFCSAVCAELVFGRLQATAGGNSVQTLQGSTGRNWLGYPIVVSQVLPTTTSTINDTPMFFFGDLGMAATLGDRRGVRMKLADQLLIQNDQIVIQGTTRLDISVHDVGDASTAGPIVALVGTT